MVFRVLRNHFWSRMSTADLGPHFKFISTQKCLRSHLDINLIIIVCHTSEITYNRHPINMIYKLDTNSLRLTHINLETFVTVFNGEPEWAKRVIWILVFDPPGSWSLQRQFEKWYRLIAVWLFDAEGEHLVFQSYRFLGYVLQILVFDMHLVAKEVPKQLNWIQNVTILLHLFANLKL